ncbi:hypothetical protein GJ496_004362 [Pomphorhynchus laevis]|nr:hypothetical protein GJ496_004362 [Pomphorhynchus laevis]
MSQHISPINVAKVEELLSTVELPQNQYHQMTEEEVRSFLQSFPEFKDCRFEVEIVQAHGNNELPSKTIYNSYNSDINQSNLYDAFPEITEQYSRVDDSHYNIHNQLNDSSEQIYNFVDTQSLMDKLNSEYQLASPEEEMKNIIWRDEVGNHYADGEDTAFQPESLKYKPEESVTSPSRQIYRIPPMPQQWSDPSPTSNINRTNENILPKLDTGKLNMVIDKRNSPIMHVVNKDSTSTRDKEIQNSTQASNNSTEDYEEINNIKVNPFTKTTIDQDNSISSEGSKDNSKVIEMSANSTRLLPSVQELANKFSKTLSQDHDVSRTKEQIKNDKTHNDRNSRRTSRVKTSKKRDKINNHSINESNSHEAKLKAANFREEKNGMEQKKLTSNSSFQEEHIRNESNSAIIKEIKENRRNQRNDKSIDDKHTKRHIENRKYKNQSPLYRKQKYCFIGGEKFKIVNKPYYNNIGDVNAVSNADYAFRIPKYFNYFVNYDDYLARKGNRNRDLKNRYNRYSSNQGNSMFPSVYNLSYDKIYEENGDINQQISRKDIYKNNKFSSALNPSRAIDTKQNIIYNKPMVTIPSSTSYSGYTAVPFGGYQNGGITTSLPCYRINPHIIYNNQMQFAHPKYSLWR